MSIKPRVSSQTRRNWIMDALLFGGALTVVLSGVYFLFLPVGGYQGGRNPFYGIKVIFERQTWDLIHTWGGVAMILAALVHLALHWDWVASMSKRIFRQLIGRGNALNRRGQFNILINILVAASFSLAALSGIYFLFFPGGHQTSADTILLLSRTTWDLIHTWSAVVLIIAAIIHFAIHWQWVVKVSRKLLFGVFDQWTPGSTEREQSVSA
jgi:hypothetical protein